MARVWLQRMRRRAWLWAVLPGAAMPLAFAPFHLWWLSAPLLLWLFVLWDGQAPRDALKTGLAFGAAQFLAGTYWVTISIHQFGGAPLWLAAFLMLGLALIMAGYFGLLGWLVTRCGPPAGPLRWLLVLPAAWALVEWLRGWFLSGFGWLALGYAQTDSWLAGWLPVLGVYGTGLLVVLTAGGLRTLCVSGAPRALAAGLLASVWLSGALLMRVEWTEPRERTLSVALLQGAVPQDLKWLPEQLPVTLALYEDLTRAALGHDLIVWPEAAIPVLAHEVSDYLDGIRRIGDSAGSAVVMGILRYDFDRRQYENTLMALRDEPLVYLKRHLVPFGEYFPVPAWVRNRMRLMSLPYTDIAAGGAGQPAWELAGERLALSICYEDLFGEQQIHYYPEATMLLNVSNDAWFGDSIAPHQHLQIARTRAIEGRRYMLRATNTGVSAIIDHRGRIIARSPQFETDVLTGEARGRDGWTPYGRWGNRATVLLALAMLAAGGLVMRRSPRR